MGYKPKTNRRETTPEKRAQVWTRYLDGHSIAHITRLEDLPRSTVRGIIDRRKALNHDSFKSKARYGPKEKLNKRNERALIRHASRFPKDTLLSLCTPSKSGHAIKVDLVRRILHKHGKHKRKPRKKPWISPSNKMKRLIWCKKEKKLWKDGKRNYQYVCWSDEVTFYIGEDGNICYVTRGPGEEFLEKNLKPTFKSGRSAVGVWSCFCGDEMGPLVVIPQGGRMNAVRYKEICEKHFIPFYRRMKRKYGKGVVVQEDNAPWHTAKIVKAMWAKSGVPKLDWCPQSPDLTPIENLWKQIKNKTGRIRHRVKNFTQMEAALAEVWPTIEKDLLRKLNDSVPRRLTACIKAGGGSTKY